MESKTRILVEGGIMVGLAQILSYVVVFQMPQGGSVTAGSMIPVLVFALRWGPARGVSAAVVYGVLQFILGPKYTFHVVSILFDYVLAFGALGLAGFFGGGGRTRAVAGSVLGIGGRFVCHYISGVVIWSVYAAGMNPFLYSLVYNAAYLLPEMVVSALILVLIYEPVMRGARRG